jgi:serine/threonine protein phosphatase 1
MRTIAVGDIHGCVKALQSLLDAVSPQPDDLMIFLGDYVDRGPDSKGVIDLLLNLQAQCQTVFLLGNHEIMFRGALAGLPAEFWLQSGGSQTVTSYGGLLNNVSPQHVEFLHRCLPSFETANHIFVHANYVADLPLCEQPEEVLYWRHLSDGLPNPHSSGKHVVCGHTPQPYGNIGYYQHLTCLDTCCFGGYWLSALDVDTGETWQVSREGHLRENWRLLKNIWNKLQSFKRR